MTDTITPIPFDRDLRICPACGYRDGFHTMLRKNKGRLLWLFICPACHGIFDAGVETKDTISDKFAPDLPDA